MDDPHYNRLYSSGPSARQPTGRRLSQARQLAAQQRDAALARIGSTRRWVIAGAAGLSAAFAALVYALAPGHSLSSAHAATSPAQGTSQSAETAQHGQPQLPAPAGPAALGLGGGGGSSSGGGGSSSSSDDGEGSSSSGGSGSAAPAPAQTTPAPAPAPSSPPVTSGGS